MSSKSITEQPDRPGGLNANVPEVAPSRLRDDDQSLPRTFGLAGAVLLTFGSMALGFYLYGQGARINPGWAVVLVTLGICSLLYHAAFDRDVMFRRIYQLFALVLLAVGFVLCLIPYPTYFAQLRLGAPVLGLAILFFVAGIHNEEDPGFRSLMELIFGGAGAAMALVGLIGGSISPGFFLLPLGITFAVLGLIYLGAFISNRGISDDLAYYAAVGMTVLGILVILIPVFRALLTQTGMSYFAAYGLILITLGLGYVFAGGGLASDSHLLIQLRRELGAFFFSPITYLVLIGFSGVWFVSWWNFLHQLTQANATFEPIVRNYLFSLFPVIMVILAPPILTMGLFSEESRSGTLEVLLTAPVSELTVVLSKFLAALITYLLVWMPAGLYLLAIPLFGGRAFDYQPLLSFFVAVLVSGAAFVSMGVFFSSLTRNMLVAAVLSITMMLVLTFVFFLSQMLSEPKWSVPLTHMSYLDFFFNSLEGKLTPRMLLFPLSLTVLFLFLTLKVLESRKWR